MKRELHPLVTILVGAGFGAALGLLGLVVAVLGPGPFGARDALLLCLVLTGIFALVFGLAHAGHWAYYRFPAIREGARGGFYLGVILGLCLMVGGCVVSLVQGESPRVSDALPYLIGIAGGVLGFLAGIGISIFKHRQ